jgi:hypothetical protein
MNAAAELGGKLCAAFYPSCTQTRGLVHCSTVVDVIRMFRQELAPRLKLIFVTVPRMSMGRCCCYQDQRQCRQEIHLREVSLFGCSAVMRVTRVLGAQGRA